MLSADWAGQRLLESACRILSVWGRGDLILDDTFLPKPLATALEGWAWAFSSQERRPVLGCSLALRVWTNGNLRLPLGIRLWHRRGPSTYALALEWLSFACHCLRCRPAYALFDAWYPLKAMLKRIRDYGWYFVCRLKKHRRLNGHAVRYDRHHPYWAESSWLRGGLALLTSSRISRTFSGGGVRDGGSRVSQMGISGAARWTDGPAVVPQQVFETPVYAASAVGDALPDAQ
jgi:hypothetical protein